MWTAFIIWCAVWFCIGFVGRALSTQRKQLSMSRPETYDEIRDHVAQIRPELVSEMTTTWGFHQLGSFLNEYFPIPGGWNTQSVDDSPATLKHHYPAK